MSCTVVALPYALAYTIGAVVLGLGKSSQEMGKLISTLNTETFELDEDIENEDVHEINASHFIEKDFETAFTDRDLLIKTLEEHGVHSITEYDGKIFGKVDNFTLNFEKSSVDKPYNLRITCTNSDNAEEKVQDLSTEYVLNVQENAYLSIVEKLKENNMQIESETVEDDNTIVLTINIE
ncbi:MAG: hypothetical protein MJ237_05010 [bacterium]|nr:hypothetical protein [bacterium]